MLLQELERQELEIQSSSNSELDAEVRRLEDQITNGYDGQTVSDELDRLLSESVEEIDSAKRVICCCSQHLIICCNMVLLEFFYLFFGDENSNMCRNLQLDQGKCWQCSARLMMFHLNQNSSSMSLFFSLFINFGLV